MSDYYALHKSEAGDIEPCCRCSAEEIPTHEVTRPQGPPSLEPPVPYYVCRFCWETHLGTILKHERMYPAESAMARATAQAFNVLLAELKRP